MAITKKLSAGVYIFVENPTAPSNSATVPMNYRMHYLTANDVYANTTVEGNVIEVSTGFGGIIYLYPTSEIGSKGFPQTIYSVNSAAWRASGLDGTTYTVANTTLLRTITVETDTTVPETFYTWFTANTVLQPKLSVDLTTLSGWANLTPGNHTIKIVAKGTGYRDSEKSAGVEVTKAAVAYTDCLTFTGETSEFTLAVGTNGAKEWDGTLYYSTDHNTWNVWDGTAISSANKKLYLRGKNNTKFYTSNGARLSLSAKAACSGNIQTLLDWENPPTSISSNSCYRQMFANCANLTSAPELPATTMTDSCYAFMFRDCDNLTTAPELPATTLAAYCYYQMFMWCNNLTTAPSILPATILAKNCYNDMFSHCENLTTAPALPATTLVDRCYQEMFENCAKLKVNTSSGNKIFTCPSTISANFSVFEMFEGTGGTFTGTPTSGNTYYWTE